MSGFDNTEMLCKQVYIKNDVTKCILLYYGSLFV